MLCYVMLSMLKVGKNRRTGKGVNITLKRKVPSVKFYFALKDELGRT